MSEQHRLHRNLHKQLCGKLFTFHIDSLSKMAVHYIACFIFTFLILLICATATTVLNPSTNSPTQSSNNVSVTNAFKVETPQFVRIEVQTQKRPMNLSTFTLNRPGNGLRVNKTAMCFSLVSNCFTIVTSWISFNVQFIGSKWNTNFWRERHFLFEKWSQKSFCWTER